MISFILARSIFSGSPPASAFGKHLSGALGPKLGRDADIKSGCSECLEMGRLLTSPFLISIQSVRMTETWVDC